jgi:hypothetical protein
MKEKQKRKWERGKGGEGGKRREGKEREGMEMEGRSASWFLGGWTPLFAVDEPCGRLPVSIGLNWFIDRTLKIY